MSGSREQILGRIRSGLTQAAGPLREAPEALEKRTLDHPRALPLYQRMGFTPYAQEEAVLEEVD